MISRLQRRKSPTTVVAKFSFYITLISKYIYFLWARRFACSDEAESYVDGSVATGGASLAGQVSTEEPDEVCPTTTHVSIQGQYLPVSYTHLDVYKRQVYNLYIPHIV